MEKTLKIIDANSTSFVEYIYSIKSQLPYIITFFQREIKIKYVNTLLGLGWQIGIPFIQIAIFSIFYGLIFTSNKGIIDSILYVTSGFLIWNIFIQSVQQIGNSFIQQFQLIKRSPVLPIVIAISKLLNILLDQAVLAITVLLLLIISSITIHPKILWSIPLIITFIAIVFFWGLAVGVLSTYKRDILLIIPYIQLIGIWFTPVFYPISFVPENLQKFFFLQPIAAFIDLFRWSFNVQTDFSIYSLIGVIIGVFPAILAWFWYRKQEPFLVDRL